MNQLAIKNKYIIGVDEVGCGALSGDVYVCAFAAPKEWRMEGVADSKVISKTKRENVFYRLMNLKDVKFSIVSAHPNSNVYREYGENLHGLLKYLYWQAVSNVIIDNNSLIILDGIIKFPEHPHKLAESVSLPKADSIIQHVGAASIIAKVMRDQYITRLGKKFPQYNWASNKGYPSKEHLAAIKEFGICEEHRKSFKPIKDYE